jgi:prophage tail gpP-like protein
MLLIGDHSYTPNQNLIEGENIEKMQCIISNEMMARVYSVLGQGANAETLAPAMAAQMRKDVTSGLYKGFYKFNQTVLEHPAMSIAEVNKRAYYELRFRDGTLIRAFVTVQGWLRDGKNLWRTGDDVYVNAPMAMINFVMKIQTCTFQQDNQSGTTTVLELVMPWMLADKPYGIAASPADVPSDVTETQPM